LAHSGDGNGKAVLQAVGRTPGVQTIVNDDEKADTDMRMCRLPLLCGLLVFLLLSGCANPATMRTQNLESVRAGMTRDQVLEIMGPPQRQETYGSTEFWIYSTDGASTTALLDFTPIGIVDGHVTGTGRKLYDAVVQAHSRYRPDR
jgi:hypothetical protein